MKKKLLTMLLLSVLAVSAVACGDKDPSESINSESSEEENSTQPKSEESESSREEETQSDVPEESDQMQESNNTHTVDGITISTGTFSVEPYEDNQGEYTKRIVMEFTIKNESDSAFGYVTTWEGRLSDGYKLKTWADLMSMDLNQVASGSEKTDKAYFLLDDSIDPDEITVSYNFMDYGEEYWEDFGKIVTGEMGEDEYMSKYGDYEVLEFNVVKE